MTEECVEVVWSPLKALEKNASCQGPWRTAGRETGSEVPATGQLGSALKGAKKLRSVDGCGAFLEVLSDSVMQCDCTPTQQTEN